MINIKNRQRKIKVDLIKLKKDSQKILDNLNYSDFDLGILLTTNKTIQKYNKDYRKKDKPTDILSFPFHPTLKPDERIKIKNEEDKNLGDLIISLENVQNAARQLNENFYEHLRMLLVHGILHLLGHDHIKDKDYELMHKEEKKILKILAKKNET